MSLAGQSRITKQLGEQGILGKDVELIRGVIIQKVSKSPLHCKLTKRIFKSFLALEGAGIVAFSEVPLSLADSEPEPDAMMVLGDENDYAVKLPTTAELVVEVAVSSAALDRQNAGLYAEAGVKEYWIVLGPERQIEVYRQPENGIYQQKRTYSLGETLLCECVPGLQAPLGGLVRLNQGLPLWADDPIAGWCSAS